MTVVIDDCRTAVVRPPGSSELAEMPAAHPITACLETMAAALTDVAEARCWSLSDADVADLISSAHQLGARLDELTLRLVAEAAGRDFSAEVMATSTAAWLAASQRRVRSNAARDVQLAADLEHRYPQTRAALASGAVNTEQAEVIVAALRQLPATVPAAHRATAEAWLLDHAATFGPDDLRILGRRVFEVIDPDAADAALAKLLEAEEARARARTRLWLRPVGDGTTRGGFSIPDAQADLLTAALDALVSPRRPGAHPDPAARPADLPLDPELDYGRLPHDQRLGDAFCQLIEHLPLDQLPQSGRSTPTVSITIDYGVLVSGLGTAAMSTGTTISAAQARRLACTAGLLPVVLSGDSVALDLGREARLFTRHQRVAMGTVQGGCIADGCDRPPAWCEAHHPQPWASGGRTDIHGPVGGVLLCGRHHHLVHQQGWDARIAPDGIPELLPPPHIDPSRTPLRHRRFRRRQGAGARESSRAAAGPAPPR